MLFRVTEDRGKAPCRSNDKKPKQPRNTSSRPTDKLSYQSLSVGQLDSFSAFAYQCCTRCGCKLLNVHATLPIRGIPSLTPSPAAPIDNIGDRADACRQLDSPNRAGRERSRH